MRKLVIFLFSFFLSQFSRAACYYDLGPFIASCANQGYGVEMVTCPNNSPTVPTLTMLSCANPLFYDTLAANGYYCPALGINIEYSRLCDAEGPIPGVVPKIINSCATTTKNSIVYNEDQVLSEEIPLTGVMCNESLS